MNVFLQIVIFEPHRCPRCKLRTSSAHRRSFVDRGVYIFPPSSVLPKCRCLCSSSTAIATRIYISFSPLPVKSRSSIERSSAQAQDCFALFPFYSSLFTTSKLYKSRSNMAMNQFPRTPSQRQGGYSNLQDRRPDSPTNSPSASLLLGGSQRDSDSSFGHGYGNGMRPAFSRGPGSTLSNGSSGSMNVSHAAGCMRKTNDRSCCSPAS
jgi:hypothetical protein